MNKFVILFSILRSSLFITAQSNQNDTTKLYWSDGLTYKYLEFQRWTTLKDKPTDKVLILEKKYFTKIGEKISQQHFIEQYGQSEIGNINSTLSFFKSAIETNNKASLEESPENLYSEYCRVADEEFSSKKYKSALSYYKKAQKIKPKEVYPLDRIHEVETILKYNAIK